MKYFPFTNDGFTHSFGVRALDHDETLLEVTAHYRREIQIKRELLRTDRRSYAVVEPEQFSAQSEAVEYLLSRCDHIRDGRNELLNETVDLSVDPLLSLSIHLQEDLVILANDVAEDFPIIAGVVCFPSGWSFPEKLGRGIVAVHEPVPEFASVLATPTQHLLTRLKINRPVWRMNWGVRPSNQLDQSPRHADYLSQQQMRVTADNAGERCFLRVERQTLSRLPQSSNILFTIHTHQTSLSELTSKQKRMLCKTLQTCPRETVAYKGLAEILTPVLGYLSAF